MADRKRAANPLDLKHGEDLDRLPRTLHPPSFVIKTYWPRICDRNNLGYKRTENYRAGFEKRGFAAPVDSNDAGSTSGERKLTEFETAELRKV